MPFFWFFVVVAITYNQGAARPTEDDFGLITKNGLEGSNEDLDKGADDKKFLIPTKVKQGLLVTIVGTLNTNDKAFVIALPSTSGGEDCVLRMDYSSDSEDYSTLEITPGVEEYESTPYPFNFSPGETITFNLTIWARTLPDGTESFRMSFSTENGGSSSQLICHVKNYEDIKYIEIREGVRHINSLLFEFRYT